MTPAKYPRLLGFCMGLFLGIALYILFPLALFLLILL